MMSVTVVRRLAAAAIVLAAAGTAHAQSTSVPGQQLSAPVIQSAGISIKVDDPTFAMPAGHVFKAVFEINAGGGDTVEVNEQLVTMARDSCSAARPPAIAASDATNCCRA